jgi:hypothetical protein
MYNALSETTSLGYIPIQTFISGTFMDYHAFFRIMPGKHSLFKNGLTVRFVDLETIAKEQIILNVVLPANNKEKGDLLYLELPPDIHTEKVLNYRDSRGRIDQLVNILIPVVRSAYKSLGLASNETEQNLRFFRYSRNY